MEQHPTHTHTEHQDTGTKEIWRTFWILLGLTIVELAIGFYMYKAGLQPGFFKNFLKGLIVVLMLMKAFYIVAYFMHLKAEINNLIMTIVVPLLLFVWFIIAFLMEGSSYNSLRNSLDRNHNEKSTAPVSPEMKGSKETPSKVTNEKPAHTE
ncbi:MAG: cytochrome C oxidase subunit IV family protein [Chitinophagaceae bacterium]|nr:cytochrome C oxidase subunit IV family protein [Chitinophagaceae bacterium]